MNHLKGNVGLCVLLCVVALGVDTGRTWAQCETAKLNASDAAEYESFGVAVSAQGGRVAVGAQLDMPSGAVYIYRNDAGTWVEEAKLTVAGLLDDERFGSHVALGASEDVILVGAHGVDFAGADSGAAYIFRRTGTTWAYETQLTPSDAASLDYFGSSVSLGGDLAVVGAWGDDDGFDRAGSAYVFRWTGSTWVEEQKLLAGVPEEFDDFGNHVSTDGVRILVSAPGSDSAYVFAHDGTEWVEEARVFRTKQAIGFSNGDPLEILGDVAIIGAPNMDNWTGEVSVFRDTGGGWVEEAVLLASNAWTNSYFGYSVDLDTDAVLVGAGNGKVDGVAGQPGASYLFQYDGATWSEHVRFIASDATDGDRFGRSVAMTADAVAVGAIDDDDFGADSGSVYVFDRFGPDCNDNGVYDGCEPIAGITPDCNGNGIPDDCDIADGTSEDCSSDGVPDECDDDCNGNGEPDSCDIWGGTSIDCNQNGIPDDCIWLEEDCLGNGVPDWCDIASGTSNDCNGNGIPDRCNWLEVDCNDNLRPDSCEITPWTGDCNDNAVPDDCDVAGGTSTDLNGNGVPDECEDCNGNGAPDDLDIADGTSQDCDENGDPDECQRDCDGDDEADACEILNGTATDIDGDGFPDECGKIYWAVRVDSQNPLSYNALRRGNTDGSNVQLLSEAKIFGVKLDIVERKLYVHGDTIWRTNLDGTGVEFLHDDGAAALDLDLVNDKIYWQSNNQILRANTDGTGVEIVIDDPRVGGRGLAVNPMTDQLYWSEWETTSIYRATTDGSGIELIYTNPTSPREHMHLAIDFCNGKLYWSDPGTYPGAIRRANLDGSDVEDVLYWRATGIDLDLVHDKIYWVYGDAGEGDVHRANLDGTGFEALNFVENAGNGREVAVDTGAGDCNANGILDRCEVVSGYAPDCNLNEVPDDCEAFEDCNGNGIMDICDGP
ncbi:MAG: DUF5050 domain-containing protein, partial [Phycisphaerae bacterium]